MWARGLRAALFFVRAVSLVVAVRRDPGRVWAVLRAVKSILEARRRGLSLCQPIEQLALLEAVFAVPQTLEGCVAEFGAYRGATTALLSIACRATGRTLIVFDSFQGLPEGGRLTHVRDSGGVVYRPADMAASLEQVKTNVRELGDLNVCEFVPGFYDQSLTARGADDQKLVLAFEDADLPSSVRSVLEYAWPRLQPGCRMFSHEGNDLEVVKIFFDDGWWCDRLGQGAPGIVIPGTTGPALGYATRRTC